MDLNRVAWLCAVFCFAQVCAHPTNCALQEHLMKKSYNLLDTVGGFFPERCLDDFVSVPFPRNAFDASGAQQVAGAEKAIYKTLQNIIALFENDGVPERWSAEKMDRFLQVIHRQTEDCACIMNKSETGQDLLDRDAALKVYFDTVSANLKAKDFSYCAWEVARKEVLHTLKFILKHNADIML